MSFQGGCRILVAQIGLLDQYLGMIHEFWKYGGRYKTQAVHHTYTNEMPANAHLSMVWRHALITYVELIYRHQWTFKDTLRTASLSQSYRIARLIGNFFKLNFKTQLIGPTFRKLKPPAQTAQPAYVGLISS